MKRMKQWMHWVLALVLLVMSLSVPAAAAETITVNVTNTPVRGSVALEKTGLQLVRFTDEQDEWGNTVMKPVYQQGYLKGAVFELRAAADVVGKEGTVFYKQGGTGANTDHQCRRRSELEAAAAGQLLLAGSFRSGRLSAG